jgi:hypothetical protein
MVKRRSVKDESKKPSLVGSTVMPTDIRSIKNPKVNLASTFSSTFQIPSNNKDHLKSVQINLLSDCNSPLMSRYNNSESLFFQVPNNGNSKIHTRKNSTSKVDGFSERTGGHRKSKSNQDFCNKKEGEKSRA